MLYSASAQQSTYTSAVSHLQVCVFTAPLFSAFCALTTYFLAKEVRNQGAGLFAALFAASVPSYISRSVAGSYDNEGVAIFALVLVFFLYVKVSRHDTQFKLRLSCFKCQQLLQMLWMICCKCLLHTNFPMCMLQRNAM